MSSSRVKWLKLTVSLSRWKFQSPVSLLLWSAIHIPWTNSLSHLVSEQQTNTERADNAEVYTLNDAKYLTNFRKDRHGVRHQSDTDSCISVNWSTAGNTDCTLARMRLISQPTQRNSKTGCVSHSLGGPHLTDILTFASLISRLAGGRGDELQLPHKWNRRLWLRVPQKVVKWQHWGIYSKH